MKTIHIAVVALGGGGGAVARYVLGGWISVRAGPGFPWGTLVINASGSFVLCLLATLALERFTLSRTWFIALGVGFCGGYTTFSTFSYETLRLAAEGSWARAGYNVVASVAAGILAGLLGILVGRAV
ncbi:MAG TPA: fluoride efflux transporter CrcB [Armatimonadota bacterium]|jgi:CrcB protein